MSQQHL
jgi:methionyl aminopeptidase